MYCTTTKKECIETTRVCEWHSWLNLSKEELELIPKRKRQRVQSGNDKIIPSNYYKIRAKQFSEYLGYLGVKLDSSGTRERHLYISGDDLDEDIQCFKVCVIFLRFFPAVVKFSKLSFFYVLCFFVLCCVTTR